MSRCPSVYIVQQEVLVRIRKAQETDQFIKAVRNILADGEYENFKMKAGLLFKNTDGRELLVVPHKMEKEIIKIKHEDGHFGVKKTIHLILQEFYIPHLNNKVQSCIDNCIKCILASKKLGKQEGFLHCIDKADKPLWI